MGMDIETMPLLSVIIPCYNVEKYIYECIDSVLSQSYANIELILVDDGSSDATSRICDEFASSDTRVTVIHQGNKGVGASRNVGISRCHGDFITFVDSDDKVSHDVYDGNIQLLVNGGGADILQFPFCRLYEDGTIIDFDCGPDRIIKDAALLLAEFADKNRLRSYVCNKIFKKSVFDNVIFHCDIYFEDRYFIADVIEKTSGVIFSTSGLYFYRVIPSQITQMPLNSKWCLSQIKADLNISQKASHYRSTYNIQIKRYSNCLYFLNKLKDFSPYSASKEMLTLRDNAPTLYQLLFSNVSLGLKIQILKYKIKFFTQGL